MLGQFIMTFFELFFYITLIVCVPFIGIPLAIAVLYFAMKDLTDTHNRSN